MKKSLEVIISLENPEKSTWYQSFGSKAAKETSGFLFVLSSEV